jgi:ketosteroid isomerase-like protein
LGEDESEIRRLDREWNEAYPRRDLAALGRVLADDWLCIDGRGLLITKEELLERVRAAPPQFDEHRFDEFDLRLFGDAAVVTGRLSGSGTDEGGAFSFSQRFTRVYARRGGTWQAVATQVTPVSS